jgi:hypothetical protein
MDCYFCYPTLRCMGVSTQAGQRGPTSLGRDVGYPVWFQYGYDLWSVTVMVDSVGAGVTSVS